MSKHGELALWLLSNDTGDIIIKNWMIDITRIITRTKNSEGHNVIQYNVLKAEIIPTLSNWIIESGLLGSSIKRADIDLISNYIYNGIYLHCILSVNWIRSASKPKPKSSKSKKNKSKPYTSLEFPFKYEDGEDGNNEKIHNYLWWYISCSIKSALDIIEEQEKKREKKELKEAKEAKKLTIASAHWKSPDSCKCSDDSEDICVKHGIILGLGEDGFYIDIINKKECSSHWISEVKKKFKIKHDEAIPVHCIKCITVVTEKDINIATKHLDNAVLCCKCRDYAMTLKKKCGHTTEIPSIDFVARSFGDICSDCQRLKDQESESSDNDNNNNNSDTDSD